MYELEAIAFGSMLDDIRESPRLSTVGLRSKSIFGPSSDRARLNIAVVS